MFDEDWFLLGFRGHLEPGAEECRRELGGRLAQFVGDAIELAGEPTSAGLFQEQTHGSQNAARNAGCAGFDCRSRRHHRRRRRRCRFHGGRRGGHCRRLDRNRRCLGGHCRCLGGNRRWLGGSRGGRVRCRHGCGGGLVGRSEDFTGCLIATVDPHAAAGILIHPPHFFAEHHETRFVLRVGRQNEADRGEGGDEFRLSPAQRAGQEGGAAGAAGAAAIAAHMGTDLVQQLDARG